MDNTFHGLACATQQGTELVQLCQVSSMGQMSQLGKILPSPQPIHTTRLYSITDRNSQEIAGQEKYVRVGVSGNKC